MRRPLALLVAALAAAALAQPAARASVVCEPIGPVPGYGPVCTVRCALKTQVRPDDPAQPVVFDSCWWED